MLEEILKPIITALGTVVAGFLIVVLHRLSKKLGITLSNEQEAQLEGYARQGVLWVEEEAKRRLKAGLPRMTPEEKGDLALTKVLEWAPTSTHPDDAVDKIKATLPTLGLGASGKVLATPGQ
jgi:hypothetical protein